MTTTDQTQTRPKWTGLGATDQLLLPDGAVDVPPVVAAANDAATEAHARLQQARVDFLTARERLKNSPAIDRRADAAAVSAGDVLPTKRAEPAAREAYVAADRHYKACRTAFDEAQRQLATAIVGSRVSWRRDLDVTITESRKEVADLLARLARALDTLEAQRSIANGLGTFPVQGSLIGATLGRPARMQGSPATRRAKAIEDLRKSDHIGGTGRLQVQRDQATLLAALFLIVEGK